MKTMKNLLNVIIAIAMITISSNSFGQIDTIYSNNSNTTIDGVIGINYNNDIMVNYSNVTHNADGLYFDKVSFYNVEFKSNDIFLNTDTLYIKMTLKNPDYTTFRIYLDNNETYTLYYCSSKYYQFFSNPDEIIKNGNLYINLSFKFYNVNDSVKCHIYNNVDGIVYEYCSIFSNLSLNDLNSLNIKQTNGNLYKSNIKDVTFLKVKKNTVNIIENKTKTTKIKLYPNPTADVFNVELNDNEFTNIEMYSTNGQKIRDFDNSNNNNISDLPNGLYFIRIYKGNNVIGMEKIIKK